MTDKIIHPTPEEYERVSAVITLYRPEGNTAVIDDTRSTEYTIVAHLDNQYNHPIVISVTILPDGIVTTNVGIAFSSVDAFCRGFWSVDWFHFSTSANDVTPLI